VEFQLKGAFSLRPSTYVDQRWATLAEMRTLVKGLDTRANRNDTSIKSTEFRRVALRSDWYGYIANVSVRTTGQLGFEFVYPADLCCQNVLFYVDEQAAGIGPRMNCWQREYVLRPEHDQILRLTPSFSWSGCHVVGSDSPDPDAVGDLFVCKGGRSFSVYADRLTSWYIAVSNCATLAGIELRYRLEVRRTIVAGC